MCNISLALNKIIEKEVIEKGIVIGIEKGKEEGVFLTCVTMLKTMLARGMSEEEAFSIMDVTSEEEKLALLAKVYED